MVTRINIYPLSQWCGVKPPRTPRRLGASGPVRFSLDSIQPPIDWTPYCIPTVNQHGPSCDGQATANYRELTLRRLDLTVLRGPLPNQPGEQVDGWKIWREATPEVDQGLMLFEGPEQAIAMGIFAPGSKVRSIPREDHAAVVEQLRKTPLICGHNITQAWADPNPVNGAIKSGASMIANGGHAEVIHTPLVQDGVLYYMKLGSWGAGYGWNGHTVISAEESDRTGLDDFYWIEEPAGWEEWARSPDASWRKYITRDAQ